MEMEFQAAWFSCLFRLNSITSNLASATQLATSEYAVCAARERILDIWWKVSSNNLLPLLTALDGRATLSARISWPCGIDDSIEVDIPHKAPRHPAPINSQIVNANFVSSFGRFVLANDW